MGILHAAVVAGFLAVVATDYHPGGGFTAFIRLPVDTGQYLLPAVRDVPHVATSDGGYDGQFYAQLALDPLLRDPAIDRAMDLARYRARRILFSWTAYALGLGRAAWILEAFALQNVVVWLMLAWLLLRWFPIGSARSFVLWTACLLTHGLLSSVLNALVDGPSTFLLACCVIAAEDGRPWLLSIVLGISAVGRETNLLGATLLMKFIRRTPRSWLIVAACLIICALPLALWLDYLRSVYHVAAWSSAGNVTSPLAGISWKLKTTMRTIAQSGWGLKPTCSLLVIVAFVAQGTYALWTGAARLAGSHAAGKIRLTTPWLSVALAFFVLGLCTHQAVWAGSPGAITRVALPLTVGFNVLARRAPWPVIALGNLAVIPGVAAFVFGVT